jgi:hypothetical protein
MDRIFFAMLSSKLLVKGTIVMMAKRILCSDRLRRIPSQFSWVDHRLVQNKHICGITNPSLALYLFLVTVSDADGVSYYSDGAIGKYLNLNSAMISQTRRELCEKGLIAYSCPFYQVLSLDEVYSYSPPASNNRSVNKAQSEFVSLGNILRHAMEVSK